MYSAASVSLASAITAARRRGLQGERRAVEPGPAIGVDVA